MKKNMDRNPPEVVSYQEMILGKRKDKIKTSTIPLEGAFSLPKEAVKSTEYISFDIKLEDTLFRSKSKSNLSQIVFDIERFKTFIPSTYFKDSLFSKK